MQADCGQAVRSGPERILHPLSSPSLRGSALFLLLRRRVGKAARASYDLRKTTVTGKAAARNSLLRLFESILRRPPSPAAVGEWQRRQRRISCVNAGNGMAVAQSRLGRRGPRQTETINEAHIPLLLFGAGAVDDLLKLRCHPMPFEIGIWIVILDHADNLMPADCRTRLTTRSHITRPRSSDRPARRRWTRQSLRRVRIRIAHG